MSDLFDPITLGALHLRNRIVMAPLTRMRAVDGRAVGALQAEHYRARADAGLILTEATSVSPQGVGYPDTPGLWSDKQVAGWREVTAAVHAEGGLIVSQLWHVGRISDPSLLDGQLPVAPSAIAAEGHVSVLRPERPYAVPRALETAELPGIVEDFRKAAANAKTAGFDGVEVHAANGYLFDQFLHDGSNTRTDAYGGSVENRARLLIEVVDAILTVWPADRVGVHLNLMSSDYSMSDSDPVALFTYVAQALQTRGIAFIFAREAYATDAPRIAPELRKYFTGPVILNQGLTRESAREVLAKGEAEAVSFGRAYMANPDLVERLRQNAPLNPLHADPRDLADLVKGYNDYPVLALA
ncbi:alkene reductase [Paracoccus aminophilus]|uniref:NADH:flavin oxidoreductase/NADH oxidase n=1 Tax=Paracoccus aminophilus JCM 7686 TaxID=1367847 RepID=S5XT80_PARAH|nr:alkene reductase [Paracoccus aminophilus]AGT10689.1 NADH:flavin oxidoreductase/NADH oxidase [Paracoccus aminophilus JCM 7686]